MEARKLSAIIPAPVESQRVDRVKRCSESVAEFRRQIRDAVHATDRYIDWTAPPVFTFPLEQGPQRARFAVRAHPESARSVSVVHSSAPSPIATAARAPQSPMAPGSPVFAEPALGAFPEEEEELG
jgi:hypothetical protein